MRINDLLFENNETITDGQVKEIFSQPFFKNNGYEKLLKHYTKNLESNISLWKNRKRAYPKDSYSVFHDYINKLSKEKFGIEIRSDTLFTLSVNLEPLITFPDNFNDVILVVPKGEYKLFYNPLVDDMTMFYKLERSDLDGTIDSQIGDYLLKRDTILFNYIENYIDKMYDYEIDTSMLDDITEEIVYGIYKQYFDDEYQNVTERGFVKTFEDLKEYSEKFIDEILYNEIFDKPNFKVYYKSEEILIPSLPKEAIEKIKHDLMERIVSVLNKYKNKLDKYFIQIKETEKIPDIRVEYMLYCKEFWLIRKPTYVKLYNRYKEMK